MPLGSALALLPPALLAAGLALASTGAQAATYTSFWAFGDSLTDPGNLLALTGGALPPSPPYAGRFSNGPVWAEGVAGDFAAQGLATGNFAYGLARARLTGPTAGVAVDVPDLPDQIEAFEAASGGRLGERPLAALWFGANDILGAIASGDPGLVAAAAADAAAAVIEGIDGLAALGVHDVLVFNLPPLERTPLFNLVEPEAAPLARLGSKAFNDALASGLTAFDGTGLDVATLDIATAFDALLDDPGSLGLSDAVVPCLVPPQGGLPGSLCSEAELAGKVFFDPLHPTAAVHAEIADLVRADVSPALAPVPLPPALATLGAALAGLLAVRRRRAARDAPTALRSASG